MKRIICLLLAVIMVLSLAACGGGDTKAETSEKEVASSAEAAPETPEAPEAPAAPETPETPDAPAEPSTPEEPEAPQFEGTLVETDYFSFVYGEDWTYDPENDLSEYNKGCYVSPQVPDPENDWDKVYVNIEVMQDDSADFAKELYNRGMNAEDAVKENNDYPTRTIGGVDCWVSEASSSTYMYGYMPEENAYISIYVSKNDQWELVDPLLESIQFTVPAYEGDVTPWYWEGTPYSVAEHNTMVGSFTVNSKQLPVDVTNPTFKIFDARIQVVGNDYYILDNKQLKKYTRDGDTLKFDSDIELPYEPEEIAVGEDGTIYISDFMESMMKIQDGTQINISGDTQYVAVHPSCTWGVSYFSNNEVAKIDMTNGAITNYTLEGIKLISHLSVTDNYIVMSCTLDNEDSTGCLRVYDTDFNELLTMDKTATTTGYYGSVSTVTETANGLIVFDGNMRDVYFLDTELNLITAVDMTDLMGTDYPWPCQAITTADGSIIVVCTDERADNSCDEAIVFQLTGF